MCKGGWYGVRVGGTVQGRVAQCKGGWHGARAGGTVQGWALRSWGTVRLGSTGGGWQHRQAYGFGGVGRTLGFDLVGCVNVHISTCH